MKKWTLAIATILSISLLSTSWAAMVNDKKATQMVIEDWFAAMKNNQLDKASSYLAPQFVSIHTDGMIRNKDQELKLIKHLNMQDYHLSDFKFTTSGDVMVVTFKDKGMEKIDNKAIGSYAAGRMAVLQHKDNNWSIIAYANLDKIG